MLHQLSTNDKSSQLVANDTPLPNIDVAAQGHTFIRAVFPSHLSLLTSDTVLLGECLPSLNDAQALLKAAQDSADLIVQKAEQQAEDIRCLAEEQGQRWLANKRDELLAEMYFQQALWLSRLRPDWLESLDNTLRKLVGETVRPDAFASAISVGLQEFKKDADLQLFVHPDDFKAAEQAVAQLGSAAQLICLKANELLSLGACQLKSHDLEVSLQLDQAINLALRNL